MAHRVTRDRPGRPPDPTPEQVALLRLEQAPLAKSGDESGGGELDAGLVEVRHQLAPLFGAWAAVSSGTAAALATCLRAGSHAPGFPLHQLAIVAGGASAVGLALFGVYLVRLVRGYPRPKVLRWAAVHAALLAGGLGTTTGLLLAAFGLL
jgi:hypothetical protein